jgi:carbonic anhydrase
MVDAQEALTRLKQGNGRFVAGQISGDKLSLSARGSEPARLRKPFAIVLGCSDCSVPAEIIFDLGLGDLLVTRVPGNAAAPSQIARIEHAAESFGIRLVVVLGHSHCDAVRSTLDQLRQSADGDSTGLSAVAARIRPAVEDLLDTKLAVDERSLMAAAVEANVLASVERLLYGSDMLESLVESGGLLAIGACFSRENGRVSFLE